MLTKNYRVLYRNGEIINDDYLQFQTGVTYPANDVSFAEFDVQKDLINFVDASNLVMIQTNMMQ